MRHSIRVDDIKLVLMTVGETDKIDTYLKGLDDLDEHPVRWFTDPAWAVTVVKTTNRRAAAVVTAVARGGYSEARRVMDMLVALEHGTR